MESYQEPDYKELYFSLFRASEKAIRILIQAQQECEEQVLSAGETETAQEQGSAPTLPEAAAPDPLVFPGELRYAERGSSGPAP